MRDDDKVRADWRNVNHAWWDERAALHRASEFYAAAGGLEDFEWEELPPIEGLELFHPQCHIGTDTVALARRAARVTGLDFSAEAIEGARELAAEQGVGDRTEWVVADVYDAVDAVGGRTFAGVYTGKGALCWLPDLDRWAATMWALVEPGGFLYLSEFHPVQDIMSDDDTTIERSYFGSSGDVYVEAGSYAVPDAETVHDASVDFPHALSAVVQALIDRGFELRMLHEHPITLFARWPWLETDGDGVWRMPADRPLLPLMYSLLAVRPVTS
jgi:SAM-dependent methyltransferase